MTNASELIDTDDEISRTTLLSLPDTDAQTAIDEVWMASSHSRHLKLLLKLTLKHDKLPVYISLKGVECRDREKYDSGGFADVFYGDHENKPVALKQLRTVATASDAEAHKLKQKFHREVLLWMNLSHEYILPILGVSEEVFPNHICMVLPKMPYGSLRSYRNMLQKSGKLNGAEFDEHMDRWLHEVAQGLAYLHGQGIIHGDLHGGNALVDTDGSTKVRDFGRHGSRS